jgi:NADH-quinone oxidoreductase subunit H
MSLFERKLIARIQLRIGPDNCGPYGMFQPVADALKLFFKKNPFNGHSRQSIFGVFLLFTMSLAQLTLIPILNDISNLNHGLLLTIVCHSIISFSEILIGVSSKSKYGIIGGHRAYLQLLGSHIPFVLSTATIVIFFKSITLGDIASVQLNTLSILKVIPLAFVFFITLLMAMNRTPFDFVEAESELIAGAYTEYGGILFAMIYLADYLNLLFFSALLPTLFFSGYDAFSTFLSMGALFFKSVFVMFFVILIRATLPRYRQDQMIMISWLVLIPVLLVYLTILL